MGSVLWKTLKVGETKQRPGPLRQGVRHHQRRSGLRCCGDICGRVWRGAALAVKDAPTPSSLQVGAPLLQ